MIRRLMREFTFRSELPFSAEQVYAWHARPGAFERLAPPWERIAIVEKSGGIEDGARLVFDLRKGPFRVRWEALHEDNILGQQFVDRQIRGPFAHWCHRHRFVPNGPDACILEDHIEYRLPLGGVGDFLGATRVRRMLDRMFHFRHRRTRDDLNRHMRFTDQPRAKIAIAGGSGLIGRGLSAFLTNGGHSVAQLIRTAKPGSDRIMWNPAAGVLDAASLEGFDAVVHFGGENIAGGRWTAARKKALRDSRVQSTALLAQTLARLSRPPKVFVCASATGFYGDRGEEVLTEESATGAGFLPQICREWEAACAPAERTGIRVVNLRFGVVLTPLGGALAAMLTPFRLGFGGVLGSGRQYLSWIGLDDAIGLTHEALFNESLRGAVNVVAPNPVTNREFTKTLGRVLRRPTLIPAPAFGIRVALGEMGEALLLTGQRAIPDKALNAGFSFLQPTLEETLRSELGV